MPMRYAVLADVLRDLKLSESKPEHASAIAEVIRIENAICLNLDRRMGRSFGVPSARTVKLIVQAVYPLLLLPYPFREVTSVTVEGEVLDGAAWEPWMQGPDDWSALRLTGSTSYWYGLIEVTGISYDAPVEVTEVAIDISVAAGFLTAEQYRINHSSPTSEIGMEGLALPTRNPWNFQIVKKRSGRIG